MLELPAKSVGRDESGNNMLIEKGSKNKILRSKAKKVPEITDEIRELARKMRKIMHEANGIGLAAPQIGLPVRIFVAEHPRTGRGRSKFYALVNPEIVKTSKEKDVLEEGCLSLPGLFGPVERAEKVVLTGLDPFGKKVKVKASGILARIFQHEMDHLDGTLFIDKAKEVFKYESKVT